MLDSTVLIEFGKGAEPTTSTVLALIENDHLLGVCAVSIAEFYSGALGNTSAMDRFLDQLPCFDTTREVARTAGEYRRNFLVKGRKLSTTDMLIAAVAKAERAVLLTNNIRDFPMDDITVEQLGSTAA
ncbi:MAG: PIN domain-containing protein [Anaerolineae bacterium]